MTPVDPLALAQALIRRPSVTPADAGAMDLLQAALVPLGFDCRRMRYGKIENLYARRGSGSPNFCFAGHTDVVPPGEAAGWREDPFSGAVREGVLYGRGAVDMKGAIAAFVAAASRVSSDSLCRGSISLLITGDEEGVARDGTRRVVDALIAEGEPVDHCLVGEPTSAQALGDSLKVGRRGSLNAWIDVQGVQGHVAYPDRAANPIPVLLRLLHRLLERRLDDGYPEFQPSNLEITELEVGNPADNVIPPLARARLNIRFNPAHRGDELVTWLNQECERAQADFRGSVTLEPRISGEPFYTGPGPFTELVARAAEEVVGRKPALSTTGGASDARFIRALCPVVELGLVGATMHMIDECTPVSDLTDLSRIYQRVLELYFATFAAPGG